MFQKFIVYIIKASHDMVLDLNLIKNYTRGKLFIVERFFFKQFFYTFGNDLYNIRSIQICLLLLYILFRVLFVKKIEH